MENQIQLYYDITSLLLDKDLSELKGLDVKLRERYQEGYERGWREAKSKYCVTYRCCKCGGILNVTQDNEKEAIKGYMREHGWGHSSCER